jgi:membrane protein implicated in regulation of membrane protease activity
VTYEFVTRHAVAADGDAATLDRALREVTFGEVPLVCALVFARGLGLPRRSQTVLEAMRRRATVLEDVPGEGIVLSVTGQFWRLRGRGSEPPATAVVEFRAADGALTTETRIHVSDPVSRRRFARYWRVVRPFSGLIRVLVLRAAKRRAEATV